MTHKAVCTAEEYRGAIHEAGGIEQLCVLSSYTYIDDPGTAPMGPGRHVYTEWGTKDGAFVCEVEEHNGDFTYRIPQEGWECSCGAWNYAAVLVCATCTDGHSGILVIRGRIVVPEPKAVVQTWQVPR